jgi:hypothetical protein
MPTRHVDLLFNQVEVVEQPFRGGRDLPRLINRHRGIVEGPQDFLVFIQPDEQSVRVTLDDGFVLQRERPRVVRELFDRK